MVKTFREYLLDEMKRFNKTTARQFALFIGVDPTTVSRAIDASNPTSPGLDFLQKMALKTKVRAGALVDLAYPETAEVQRDAYAELTAYRIQQAPDNIRDAIDTILIGMSKE